MPQLRCSVGSVRVLATTNAIERFYKTRKGFHSVLSTKRALLLFLVVNVFARRYRTGHAPIEVNVLEARRMPLYCLINDPYRALQEAAA